jgi:hypothetical protein
LSFFYDVHSIRIQQLVQQLQGLTVDEAVLGGDTMPHAPVRVDATMWSLDIRSRERQVKDLGYLRMASLNGYYA